MSTSDFIEDAYEVLGLLETGLESTDADVRKAYRRLALVSHPDKRPGDKDAARLWEKVSKAYDILSDKEARKAHDNLYRVRLERKLRDEQLGSKRRKVRQDLEERERKVEVERSEEEEARARLKVEMERLRKAAAAARQDKARKEGGGDRPAEPSAPPAVPSVDLQRTLKVSWPRDTGDYGLAELRALFDPPAVSPTLRGCVLEDVVIRDNRKKGAKKGSALLVMDTPETAVSIVSLFCGDFHSPPLTVSLAAPQGATMGGAMGGAMGGGAANGGGDARGQADSEAPEATAQGYHATPPGPALHTNGVRPSPIPTAAPSAGHRDYENVTLMRMRQAAERAQLIRKMKEEDDQH
eukprot:jgi/Mesvir1/16185/Mv08450-RA.1